MAMRLARTMTRCLLLTFFVCLVMTVFQPAGWALESGPFEPLHDGKSVLQDTGARWFDQNFQKRLSSKPRRTSQGMPSMLSLEILPYMISSDIHSPEGLFWYGANTRIHTPFPWTINADVAYGAAERQDGRDPSATTLTLGLEFDLDLFTPELFMLYQNGPPVGKRDPYRGLGQQNPVLGSSLSLDLLPQEMLLAPMQGVGLRFKNVALADNLTNYLSVVYATGLLDAPMLGSSFGSDDALIGVNMDAQYALFEQLAALIEVGVLKMYPGGADEDPDADWKLSLGFRYDF
jgi:hypothetical protein